MSWNKSIVYRSMLVMLVRSCDHDYGIIVMDTSNSDHPHVIASMAINGPFKVQDETPLINFDAEGDDSKKLRFIGQDNDEMLVNIPSSVSVVNFLEEVTKATIVSQTTLGSSQSSSKWIRSYLLTIKESQPESAATNSAVSINTFDPGSSQDELLIVLSGASSETSSLASTVNETESLIGPNESTARKVLQSDFPAGVQDNYAESALLRDPRIGLRMQEYEDQYTAYERIRVTACTWNVNGQLTSEDISEWLRKEDGNSDIIAIGFQELDLSAEALLQLKESSRAEEWVKIVDKYLPIDMCKVRGIRLVGMLLLVYAKSNLREFITEIHADHVGTGIMGMMGNKGGVAVRFKLHLTTMCFVNSHLAAHAEEIEKRNQDFKEVSSKLFSRSSQPLSVLDHETTFWFGDLNYRIAGNEAIVKDMIKSGLLDDLFKFDQLNQQMSQRKVFQNFIEGPIKFIPTYKYDPGTNNWDTSEKCRAPAWCDRILWKATNVLFVDYRSHPSLKCSDHKPVSASFNVFIKVINKEKQQEILHDVIRDLDKNENEHLPQISLSQQEFNFGDIKYNVSKTETLNVVNTGKIPIRYSFNPKPGESNHCKPWLEIKPASGNIMKGKSAEISLIMKVTSETATKLNTGEDKLEDILILHLDDGKEHFVSITGNYLPSCFGVAIETLVYIPGGIREIPISDLLDSPDGKTVDKLNTKQMFEKIAHPDRNVTPLEIPKELWLLMDYLNVYCTEKEGIFTETGLETEMMHVRDAMDTLSFPQDEKFSAFSVANCLLEFLDAFPQPVIPHSFFQKCIDNCNNFIACKQILQQIPTSHRNTFKYVCAFLRKLLLKIGKNKLDAKTLATIFGEILLKPIIRKKQISSRALEQMKRRRVVFVCQFLTHEYDE